MSQARNNVVSEPSDPLRADGRWERFEAEMKKRDADYNLRFGELFDAIQQLSVQQNIPGTSSKNHHREEETDSGNMRHFDTANNSGWRYRGQRTDFPRYSGQEDPSDWISRAEQFFDFHDVPDSEKVRCASWNLEQDAQIWFQLLKREFQGQDFSWELLVKEITDRFGPTDFQSHFGAMIQLRQTGSVDDYYKQFSTLLLRAGDLSQEQQITCFVAGLKEAIRIDVQACRPSSVSTAVGLAKLYEIRHKPLKALPTARTFEPPSFTTNRNHLPVKRLTPAEMADRKVRGLCFHCNDQFRPGHKCKQLFVLEGTWFSEHNEEEVLDVHHSIGCSSDVTGPPEEKVEISLNAIYGTETPRMMRIVGEIGNQTTLVNILIDSGSSHSFVDSSMAKKLGLTLDKKTEMKVLVANGESLTSTGQCNNVPVSLQGVPFHLDFFLLPLQGVDIVLGVQWLRTLGPVQWDFEKLQMDFLFNGHWVTLQGASTSSDSLISDDQFKKDLIHKDHAVLFQVACVPKHMPPGVAIAASLHCELRQFFDVLHQLKVHELSLVADTSHQKSLGTKIRPLAIACKEDDATTQIFSSNMSPLSTHVAVLGRASKGMAPLEHILSATALITGPISLSSINLFNTSKTSYRTHFATAFVFSQVPASSNSTALSSTMLTRIFALPFPVLSWLQGIHEDAQNTSVLATLDKEKVLLECFPNLEDKVLVGADDMLQDNTT